MRLLEKLDYRVDVVADGLAAVAAWQTGKFDLIIMDCQMPQMDGYEATREIRRLEDGPRRIPIVALTAHAMKGDEDKCRAAGMDDYLPKPIDRSKLEICLERLLQTGSSADAAAPVTPEPAQQPMQPPHPVDWDALMESIDGDEIFARDLAGAFIGTGDRELAAIEAALCSGDELALRESAHALKGASANLRASAATSAAARLESAAGLGRSAQIPELADNLATEIRRMTAYLRSKAG
jgi:CheY-like chemotaxis protein